jgi:transcription elongation factor Elf1
MLFYEKIKKNKHIIFLHYKNSTLKQEGWIHNCYLCDAKTSRIQKYNNNDNIFVIICKDCKIHFKNKTYADINKFIEFKINKTYKLLKK